MTNDSGLIVGIDIIKDIIKVSENCIKKNYKNLLDNENIILVNGDGRKGYKKYAPYKVIHAGAAVETIPNDLIEQLACGGRMFIPVGKINDQYICIVDKDVFGKITCQKIFQVKYGFLCNAEEQRGK